MAPQKLRGSEKLLSAWRTRALTEDSINDILKTFSNSPAQIEKAAVVGGERATGLSVVLSYSGDDVPQCGNDIKNWLEILRRLGGGVPPRPPRIIIDGTPFPDFLRMQLDFGHVGQPDVKVDIQKNIDVAGGL